MLLPISCHQFYADRFQFASARHYSKTRHAQNRYRKIATEAGTTKRYIERSVGIVTALNPVLGYEKTTELAKEALQSGKGILELIREKKLLTEEQIAKLLDPASMTGQTQKK